MGNMQIINATPDQVLHYGICGYKNIKRPGFAEKIEWLRLWFAEGLRLKILHGELAGTQGMLEYIPAEYCWRPVAAPGYLFIHCLFVGFKSLYKGKGHATQMLQECLAEARRDGRAGVAVVTRQGAFMAGSGLFLKNGFQIVDQAPPDFELLAKRFLDKSDLPRFKGDWPKKLSQYKKGLTLIRAFQCPYSVKNVNEIIKTAQEEFGITPKLIHLQDYRQAQDVPAPFGTFCIIYQGQVVADHPISNGRFRNIMNKLRTGE